MPDERKFYQHLEYLNRWKPALDARAVNRQVRTELQNELEARPRRIKVLDCGTGTGRGIIDLIEDGTLQEADVEAFDIDSTMVEDMPRLFEEYAVRKRWTYTPIDRSQRDDFVFKVNGDVGIDTKIDIKVHGFRESAYELPRRRTQLQDLDLIIGQAFIEHVNQGVVYPMLMAFLAEKGLVYFSMNCDGWFNYSPSRDRNRDERMVGLFNDLALNNQEFRNAHGAIIGGEAFCGTNLPYRFDDEGMDVLAYGPSDWVVTPHRQSDDEIQFLLYTSAYIRDRCSDPSAEEARKRFGLTERDVYDWHSEKQEAIRTGEMGFTCVQKDILGKKK